MKRFVSVRILDKTGEGIEAGFVDETVIGSYVEYMANLHGIAVDYVVSNRLSFRENPNGHDVIRAWYDGALHCNTHTDLIKD